ncbi:MAG: hypothetical protein KAH44_07110 [Oricola sp.]|nr:hypothetical protein [Oricola sp.]
MQVMTLNEYAKAADNEMTRAVTELFADSSDILNAMPFETITGSAYKYNLEDTLPGIAFRGVNESYTPDIGVENPQVESLFIAGGEADVDNFLLRTHGEGRRAREENKKIKQMSRSVTDVILSGNNSSQPREFDGLQRRLTGTQLLRNADGSGGAALSLSKLDELIASVVNPTHLIVHRKFRDVHFKALLRNQTLAGNVQLTKDDLGRPVTSYNGIPMLVGYEVGPDARILPFNEVAYGGGGAVTTSIYCVSLMEGHLWGIQSGPIATKDLGELEDKPAHRTRVEWDMGMVIENPYAAARLTSITDAPIAA